MKAFVNATWYYANPYYMELLKNETTLTDQELTNLFNPKTSGSLGEAIITATTTISTKYKCVNATNCTAQEISG